MIFFERERFGGMMRTARERSEGGIRIEKGGAPATRKAKREKEREGFHREKKKNKKLVDADVFLFSNAFAPYLRSERGVQILGAVHVTLDEGLERKG